MRTMKSCAQLDFYLDFYSVISVTYSSIKNLRKILSSLQTEVVLLL